MRREIKKNLPTEAFYALPEMQQQVLLYLGKTLKFQQPASQQEIIDHIVKARKRVEIMSGRESGKAYADMITANVVKAIDSLVTLGHVVFVNGNRRAVSKEMYYVLLDVRR